MMTVTGDTQRIQHYLKAFDFKNLFVEELGWDILKEPPLSITIDAYSYTLRPLVEKRGVKAYICDSDQQGKIPADATLRKIEREVTKHAYEHILIFVDTVRENQAWQWVKRETGQPLAARYERLHKQQSGERLAQKLSRLAFSISEEEQLLTATVSGRVRSAFDVERVTKKFYERFKVEHARFLAFIEGITAQANREWYASLMLNRLMFVYFIQRKGFLGTTNANKLDGDTNYLSHRLHMVQEQYGQDSFHSFYRYFLLKLFHDGLSKREHAPVLETLLGKIPYLNGGLFDVHELERANPDINIPDEAFEQLFAFFDEFDWHLDDRSLKQDNEINPDVLGYIFEKYINQKQMGAYYTKEDITDYIGKNTIIPYLFDAAAQKCPVAFEANGSLWSLLRDNPDRYIYDAVKKGCELALPPHIEVGMLDVAQRSEWNRPAPEEYALPTEIWREVVARRSRYAEVKAKLAAGEIQSINDLITYNLDMRQFAQDAIMYCEGTNLLRAFYESIEQVTVLDPTCGSGAFLFAALNILEPLYEACLERMLIMVDERDRLDALLASARGQTYNSDINRFRAILAQVANHPNRRYFILKSIIINNLYGVDMMEEATEICKLRLFLKLVSQVQQWNDIEPLPDIDFNIRAGNTLVGFATYAEAERAITSRLDFDNVMGRIEQKAKEVECSFANFRASQTTRQIDSEEMAALKQLIRQQLKALNAELHSYLAEQYGIDRKNIPGKEEFGRKFKQWEESHQPFHWFVEFYRIMQDGGFDVIIGNPPYVAYSKVRDTYHIQKYRTDSCGNLYAYVMERALQLLQQDKYFGMIVPVSSVSGESYKPLIEVFLQHQLWLSSYSNRPGKLFAGVEQRLTIFVVKSSKDADMHTTPYQHWYETERSNVFHRLSYVRASIWPHTNMPIKAGMFIAESIFLRLIKQKLSLSWYSRNGSYNVWLHDGPTYWVRCLPFEPNIGMKSNRSNHYHQIPVRTKEDALVLSSLLNSSTFYLFFKLVSNCRDLGQKEWTVFPIGRPSQDILENLAELGSVLETGLNTTSVKCVRKYPSGNIEYEEYYPAKSKPIIDEIDRVLAKHYGFTDEELDFIINYDIKYRMGKDSADEEPA